MFLSSEIILHFSTVGFCKNLLQVLKSGDFKGRSINFSYLSSYSVIPHSLHFFIHIFLSSIWV